MENKDKVADLDEKFETELKKVAEVEETAEFGKKFDEDSLKVVEFLLTVYMPLPSNRKNKRIVAHLLEVEKLLTE